MIDINDLPKIFKNNINKEIKNNEKVFYTNNTRSLDEKIVPTNIKQKVNEIFASPNYVYKANVEITLKDKKIKKRIIGRNKDYIITMDNLLIPINEILDIKSIKK